MLIYKVFRAAEWAELEAAGETPGAPVDRADGFVHFSTAAQLPGRCAKHFAGETGLVLVAVEAEAAGAAIRWEPSRGGALFPHLYRALDLADVLWVAAAATTVRWTAGVSLRERLALPLLRRLDPETAHGLALRGAAAGLGTRRAADHLAAARGRGVAGLELANPLGLAAGFDKNAVAVGPLVGAGLRLRRGGRRDAAAAAGQPAAAALPAGRGPGGRSTASASTTTGRRRSPPGSRAPRRGGVVGLNLGANKASADRAADYRRGAGRWPGRCRLRHRQRLLAQHRAAARAAGRRGAAAACSPGWRPRTAGWRGRCRSSSRSPPT